MFSQKQRQAIEFSSPKEGDRSKNNQLDISKHFFKASNEKDNFNLFLLNFCFILSIIILVVISPPPGSHHHPHAHNHNHNNHHSTIQPAFSSPFKEIYFMIINCKKYFR